MGYTHYWRINTDRLGAPEREVKYQKAIKQINKIAKFYQDTVPQGSDERLSGYTAHTDKYGGVHLNGSRGNDHEDFVLAEHVRQNVAFEFCETARKPYDVVVTAALIVLKHYLGSDIEVSSDGYAEEWMPGLLLATKATRLKSLRVPSSVERKLSVVV